MSASPPGADSVEPKLRGVLLTTRRLHPAARGVVDACRRLGLDVRAGRRIDPPTTFVLRWGFDLVRAPRAIRQYCGLRRIPFIDARAIGLLRQADLLAEAGLPFVDTRRATTLAEASAHADELGYPVVLRAPRARRTSAPVVARDPHELAERWRPSRGVIQTLVPGGNRSLRVLVIGERVHHAAVRVADDDLRHRRGRRPRRAEIDDDTRALALRVARGAGLDVAAVDLLRSDAGPLVLHVNHGDIDLANRALCGDDALDRVAELLARVARQEGADIVSTTEPDGFQLVTGWPASSAPARGFAQLAERSPPIVVGRALDLLGGPALLSGLTWRQWTAVAARARAVGIPCLNGNPLRLGRSRSELRQNGIRVPRTRRAIRLPRARSRAAALGYPLVLRPDGDPWTARPRLLLTSNDLESHWIDGRAWLLEELIWGAQRPWRVWVGRGEVLYAERCGALDLSEPKRRPEWTPCQAPQGAAELATRACAALKADLAIVEIAESTDGPIVLRVLQRRVRLDRLDERTRERAIELLHGALAARLPGARASADAAASGSADAAESDPTFVLARPYRYPRVRRRVLHIHALVHEIRRRTPDAPVVRTSEELDALGEESFDLLVQDPLYALGWGRRTDALNRSMKDCHPTRSHLVRSVDSRLDKTQFRALGDRLGIRSPALLRIEGLSVSDLPVIVKPRRAQRGVGVRLIDRLSELNALGPRMVVQEFIDPGIPYAVSIRAITVGPTIASAALFYNRGRLRSNLARGARPIALSGPGRHAPISSEERWLLSTLGMDPAHRSVPGEVLRASRRVGRHYGRRGVQMLGLDFVVDARRRWYFLEANVFFGVAVFNVTHGGGTPHSGLGFRRAGPVLYEAARRVFAEPTGQMEGPASIRSRSRRDG